MRIRRPERHQRRHLCNGNWRCVSGCARVFITFALLFVSSLNPAEALKPPKETRRIPLVGYMLCWAACCCTKPFDLQKTCIPEPALTQANESGAYHPSVVAGCGVGVYSLAEQGDHVHEFVTAVYRASIWSPAALFSERAGQNART
jgi:hypothetical protein